MEYPNLATSTMKELVSFYNEHSGLEPVKKFTNKEQARIACQQVIAQLEGEEPTEEVTEETAEEPTEEVTEETAEEPASALSASAQLLALASSGGKKTSEKNEGVWTNVQKLLEAGKSNKEILAEIHEMYGNSNTSYACIAWYRNKWNKQKDKGPSREDRLLGFAKNYGLSAEALAELLLIK